MISVSVNRSKNFIIITMEGFMNEESIHMTKDEILEKLKFLNKDFVVINDVSKFKPTTVDGIKEIKIIQKILVEMGAKKFIRVVESVLGKLQFKRSSLENNIQVIEVRSLEEAYKYI